MPMTGLQTMYIKLNTFAIVWINKVQCSKKHLHRASHAIVNYQLPLVFRNKILSVYMIIHVQWYGSE
jgi:hypothetical protein